MTLLKNPPRIPDAACAVVHGLGSAPEGMFTHSRIAAQPNGAPRCGRG
jgi:hypothetical protein